MPGVNHDNSDAAGKIYGRTDKSYSHRNNSPHRQRYLDIRVKAVARDRPRLPRNFAGPLINPATRHARKLKVKTDDYSGFIALADLLVL